MSSRWPGPMAGGSRARLGGRRSRPTLRVGQMRAIEFDATAEGDWAFHCHKSHHTMNAMGHDVPTMIGVDQTRRRRRRFARLIPDYMVMGEARNGRDGRDGNAAPRQHAADDDGAGTVRRHGDGRHVHDREGAAAALARDDYKDPGWYKQPPGTQATEWTGALPAPARAEAPDSDGSTINVRKPTGHQD